jgi:hypothetical protein
VDLKETNLILQQKVCRLQKEQKEYGKKEVRQLSLSSASPAASLGESLKEFGHRGEGMGESVGAIGGKWEGG